MPIIPVDDAEVGDVPDSAWDEDDSPARFYAMLDERPAAKAAFEKLSQEIAEQQQNQG